VKASANPFKGELITPQLLRAMRKLGRLSLFIREKGMHVKMKSTEEELVTEGDTLLTEAIKLMIYQLFPGCKYLDEETDNTHGIDISQENLITVIDPIDGTANYYRGSLEPNKAKRNANWGISVGFVKNGELRAGIVCQPQTGKIYYAEKGKGAYLNSKRLHVSPTPAPQGAKIIYSPPYPKDKEAYVASRAAIARIGKDIPMKVTTLGSQVIEAMQVAEGKQDIFIHLQTKPWDIAAASIIVTEAGGRSLDVQGNDYTLFGDTILLANGEMDLAPVTRIISEALHTKLTHDLVDHPHFR
jgi:myo-inositol-1(or 4)-monophosphatase